MFWGEPLVLLEPDRLEPGTSEPRDLAAASGLWIRPAFSPLWLSHRLLAYDLASARWGGTLSCEISVLLVYWSLWFASSLFRKLKRLINRARELLWKEYLARYLTP